MTDEKIKKLAYEPFTEAWRIVHLTQNLKSDDTDGWKAYVEAVDVYHEKYNDLPHGSHLEQAIMAVVDVIAKENKEGQS